MVRIILEQQVSLASAAALFGRLERSLGGAVTPERVLAIGKDGLRDRGLTRQKASYVANLAEHVVRGELSLPGLGLLSDDEAAERLTRLPGIGPWSASIYLLMALRRPDIWPPGDLALDRCVMRLWGGKTPLNRWEVRLAADRWRPWRAVAARILWHGYLSEQGLGSTISSGGGSALSSIRRDRPTTR